MEYPNEPYFTVDGFGDCPLSFVEKYLNALDRRNLEHAELHARPISYVGHYMAASKGAKDLDPDHFNTFAKTLYQQDAKSEIPVEAARLFLDLSGQKKIPAWAIAAVDIPLIRAAAV